MFVDYSFAGSGYYETENSTVSSCRYIWKDVQSSRWVVGRGPIDGDVNIPPLPVLRSMDTPWCIEDVAKFTDILKAFALRFFRAQS